MIADDLAVMWRVIDNAVAVGRLPPARAQHAWRFKPSPRRSNSATA